MNRRVGIAMGLVLLLAGVAAVAQQAPGTAGQKKKYNDVAIAAATLALDGQTFPYSEKHASIVANPVASGKLIAVAQRDIMIGAPYN